MWRPGQLITIRGIVYRVKRIDHNSKFFPCELCLFESYGVGCSFPLLCTEQLPDDCYFVRVSPTIVMK